MALENLVVFILLTIKCQMPAYFVGLKDGTEHTSHFCDAVVTNIPANQRFELATIVAAIRYTENGSYGKEYGILAKGCKKTYRSQAGWCAATVYKRYNAWVKLGSRGSFIEYLGKSYAPIGASNDPKNLNKNWVKNVEYYVAKQESIIKRTRLGL